VPDDFPTDYRFTGQRLESALGSVYHMGARFYDSALGRWLSADTIVPEPGNPQSLNRFSYCLNNPLAYVDPSGHDELWAWKNRWYNAHGWYWNAETGHWDIKGDLYFWDADIFDEVAENDPELLQSAGPENLGFHLSEHDRRTRISGYAMFLSGLLKQKPRVVDSVEVLARLVEYAAVFHGNAIQPFVDDVSSVLTGYTGFGAAWDAQFRRGDHGEYYVGPDNFDQSGLSPLYRDTGQSQLHHFWFSVHLAVFNGPLVAGVENILHDPPFINDPSRGISDADFRLSMMGVGLGIRLRDESLTVQGAGQWIRLSLGAH
jgi:RHS repeat-associated protein